MQKCLVLHARVRFVSHAHRPESAARRTRDARKPLAAPPLPRLPGPHARSPPAQSPGHSVTGWQSLADCLAPPLLHWGGESPQAPSHCERACNEVAAVYAVGNLWARDPNARRRVRSHWCETRACRVAGCSRGPTGLSFCCVLHRLHFLLWLALRACLRAGRSGETHFSRHTPLRRRNDDSMARSTRSPARHDS